MSVFNTNDEINLSWYYDSAAMFNRSNNMVFQPPTGYNGHIVSKTVNSETSNTMEGNSTGGQSYAQLWVCDQSKIDVGATG